MGLKQSKLIIWGPTSVNIYENSSTRKKIMLIGDKHNIPKEKPGISLNEMFESINVNKGIGFITEGCEDSLCSVDEGIDNCMKRAQVCKVVKNKFTTLWGDYRYKTKVNGMYTSIVGLNIYMSLFRYKWNDAVKKNPEMITKMQESVEKSIKNVFSNYKNISGWNGNNLVLNTMKEYTGFMRLLNKLSDRDKQNIFRYLNKNIYRGVSKTEFIYKYNKQKSFMVSTIKGIFTSFKSGERITNEQYNQYMSVISYMKKTLYYINNSIFEAYMIMLVIGTNFERYIIHAGAIHIYNIEEWFKSTLEYKEYFKSKGFNNLLQAVDISDLQFI
jgi:hypothetical protein